MNQKKIGEFIAASRKNSGLTQGQLAEELGISTNAVSKWERGLCLMDMSLLKPLSEILNVSVNDILAGEKIDNNDIEKKCEENLIKLSELVDLKTMRYGIIGMAVFSIVLIFVSMCKDIYSYPVVSMLCAYNTVTFLSRYKINKNKTDLTAGVLFLIAVVANTISFILI